MRRIPREVWWLLALTAVMALVAAGLSGGSSDRDQNGLDPTRTTYNNSPGGLQALYLTLGKLGYRVQRWPRPLAGEALPPGTILLAEPTTPLAALEWEALYAWVQRGNTLLFCAEESRLGDTDFLSDDLPFSEEEPRRRAVPPSQPTSLAQGVTRLQVRTSTALETPKASTPARRKGKGKKQDGPAFPFASAPRASESWGRVRARAVPVFARDGQAVVSYARVGKGSVIISASPWSFSNEGIGGEDNLRFVCNALGAPGKKSVFFDEYHHGYGENLAWALVPRPVRWALGQLLLAFAILVYARGRRFGRVVPLLRESRERSEFLGTMTALLRKGEATRLALRTAHEAALHRLRRQLGLPEEAGVAEVAQAARRLDEKGALRLQAALEHTQAALQKTERLPEGRVMSLIRELDEAERTLRKV